MLNLDYEQALDILQINDIMLRMQPIIPQPKDYFEQRREEIFALRYEKLWTYQMIADKYNISRERVRQILEPQLWNNPRIRSGKVKVWFKENGYRTDLTNRQISELLGCTESAVTHHRKDIRHKVEGNGSIAKSFEWQAWASEQLKEHGIENRTLGFKSSCNILTSNGVSINVRVATKTMTAPSLKNTSPIWRFHIQKNKRMSDFYFLIIASMKEVFIIPRDKILKSDYITFCFPSSRPRMFKWWDYHNAYHLLDGK